MSEVNVNIKKQVKEIEGSQKKLLMLAEQAKCKCVHTKRGDLDIVPARDRKPGELKYICRECKKNIDITRLQEEQLKSSCENVDRAIDVIKMQLDLGKESDAKLLKGLAKTQYRVRNEVSQLYAAALTKNRSGNRSKNRGGNNNNSSWNRPRIDGR